MEKDSIKKKERRKNKQIQFTFWNKLEKAK